MRPAKAEDSVTAAAYLLFYRRRSEQPLGGHLSNLVAKYSAKKIISEDSDSTTTSPKNDRSESSSPIPSLVPNTSSTAMKSVNTSSKFFDGNIETIYSPLKLREQATQMVPASWWAGGWSNRNTSFALGFQYGGGASQRTSGESSSSPGVESQNITPDDADADIEDANEEDEIEELEHVPIDSVEPLDDVQVIQIGTTDEDQTV